MIRALLCDLDNTLYPATSIPRDVLRPAIDAVVAANRGPGALDAKVLRRALDECWRRPFDDVASEFALSEAVQRAWSRASARLRVQGPLTPYPDVAALAALDARRFLVTTGYRAFQESKVAALGITPLFHGVYVDALDDPAARQGKAGIFAAILARHGLHPREAAVLGDSGDSEIEAGNRLGIPTIQVLRDGVTRDPRARLHIRSLTELTDALQTLATEPGEPERGREWPHPGSGKTGSR